MIYALIVVCVFLMCIPAILHFFLQLLYIAFYLFPMFFIVHIIESSKAWWQYKKFFLPLSAIVLAVFLPLFYIPDIPFLISLGFNLLLQFTILSLARWASVGFRLF